MSAHFTTQDSASAAPEGGRFRRFTARPAFGRLRMLLAVGCVAAVASSPIAGAASSSSTPATPTPTLIFDNFNPDGVVNNPTAPTVVTFAGPVHITQVATYHWNNGLGSPPYTLPGAIYLNDASGGSVANGIAYGQAGQGGVPNAAWVANVDATIPAGTYTIVDTDKQTWSQNQQSGGRGFTRIWGYYVSSPPPVLPPVHRPPVHRHRVHRPPVGVRTFRPCFTNAGAVADMGPCIARPGTTVMTVQLLRHLRSPLAKVAFRQDDNGSVCWTCAVVVVTLPPGGSTASGSFYRFVAPRALCLAGTGSSWYAFPIDAAKVSQGNIGRVMIDCR